MVNKEHVTSIYCKTTKFSEKANKNCFLHGLNTGIVSLTKTDSLTLQS